MKAAERRKRTRDQLRLPRFVIRPSRNVPGKLSIRRADDETGSFRDLIGDNFIDGDLVVMIKVGRREP